MGLIFLTGMTGSGKTTIGEKLAGKLGVPFVDLDREIERAAGRTAAEIFAQEGEMEFRDCEAVALSVAAELSDAVVALGAGALMADDTFELVQESGRLIYLKTGLDLLTQRLSQVKDRPLLAEAHTAAQLKAALEKMLLEREPRYLKADIVVLVDDRRSPDEVISQLVVDLGRS
ncbi:shikimate kinase [candidate division KSB1 bacterium]|nr:MAG: shikimate kinase [candidate division KSB1 bacterium]